MCSSEGSARRRYHMEADQEEGGKPAGVDQRQSYRLGERSLRAECDAVILGVLEVDSAGDHLGRRLVFQVVFGQRLGGVVATDQTDHESD